MKFLFLAKIIPSETIDVEILIKLLKITIAILIRVLMRILLRGMEYLIFK